ncbi:hypothetical protein S140_191 [Shewanella sp. phage 1/40]|uniref:hypothetical protein n=1 Tax=Shewanella sp. phage 1/40 TaxID=1458860 RepID=UPI0004F65C1D|nr:hypothetical protein S140_191 [Shewanella sp. phage 1/40]AHK11598.1 hypothetical protein S140_191 [Shewanella sp. phage 1/40]
MEFSNLTDEQIEWLEAKLKDAYVEGYTDAYCTYGEDEDILPTTQEFSESLAKNQTCHILAERYMKPSKVSFDVDGLPLPEDYIEQLPAGMLDKLFGDKKDNL